MRGRSRPPEPQHHAFRKDLADVALAGDVIASHYAEPVERTVAMETTLRSAPNDSGEAIRSLKPGETFLLLDDTLGWAWGYAGSDRRVGYVPSSVVPAD